MLKNWRYPKGFIRGLLVGIIFGFGIYPSILIKRFVDQGEIKFDIFWPIGIIVLCTLLGVLIEYVGKKFGKRR